MIPFLDTAVTRTRLTGGEIHAVWLTTQPDGSRHVVKTNPGTSVDLFGAEAEGLAALRDSGTIDVPDVIRVSAEYLVLQALEPAPDPYDDAFAERLGRAVARLHAVHGERFGWPSDNWFGLVPQINTWTNDGHEFFATRRILPFLSEPGVAARLDSVVIAGVERVCQRLPQLIPPSPPVLTHGDLWHANVVATEDRSPALIDPAASWNWAAVDVSAMLSSGMPPRVLDAYHEVLPPDPGWRGHARLVHLRVLLSILAHNLGWADEAARQIGELVRRYA